MLRKSLLCLFLASFTYHPAKAEGVDLNPALLGCIMSEGSCLDNTGITFIDQFFGNGVNVPQLDESDMCKKYISDWCWENGQRGRGGYNDCRNAKKAYYKQKAQKDGSWDPPTTYGFYGQHPESRYFDEIEERNGGDYFTCTAKQREIFIKARCGLNYYRWNWLPQETKHCGNK